MDGRYPGVCQNGGLQSECEAVPEKMAEEHGKGTVLRRINYHYRPVSHRLQRDAEGSLWDRDIGRMGRCSRHCAVGAVFVLWGPGNRLF